MTNVATNTASTRKLTRMQDDAVGRRAAEIGGMLVTGRILTIDSLNETIKRMSVELSLPDVHVDSRLRDFTKGFSEQQREGVSEVIRNHLGIVLVTKPSE